MIDTETFIGFGKTNNSCWRVQSSLCMWLRTSEWTLRHSRNSLKISDNFLPKLIMFSDSWLRDQEKRLSRCNKTYWKNYFYAVQSLFQEKKTPPSSSTSINTKNFKVNTKSICLLSVETILFSACLFYQLTLTYTIYYQILKG